MIGGHFERRIVLDAFEQRAGAFDDDHRGFVGSQFFFEHGFQSAEIEGIDFAYPFDA